MRLDHRALGALWALCAICALDSAGAQQEEPRLVRGRLIDAYTTQPVTDARIVFTVGGDTVARTRSDSAGTFQVRLAAGKARAHFQRIGYVHDSLEFEPSDMPLRVAFGPVAPPRMLAAVHVSAQAFDARARRGVAGRYITPERIAQLNPSQTSDALRGLAGVRIVDSAGVVSAVSQRALRMTQSRLGNDEVTLSPTGEQIASAREIEGQNCAMRIGVNGVLLARGVSLNDIRPEELYGIEVYSGAASMPAEFAALGNDVQCGLVLIWTKALKEKP